MAPVGNLSSKLGFFFTNGCFCNSPMNYSLQNIENPRSCVIFSVHKNVYNLYYDVRFYLRSNFCDYFEPNTEYMHWPSQEGQYCVPCEIQSNQLVNSWQWSKSPWKQNFCNAAFNSYSVINMKLHACLMISNDFVLSHIIQNSVLGSFIFTLPFFLKIFTINTP